MKHEITSAEFPLYNYSTSLGCDVKLYFLDGAADLPYIEANDFLPRSMTSYSAVLKKASALRWRRTAPS